MPDPSPRSANDAPVTELLVSLCRRWEHARATGTPIPPEELCRDRPDLLPDLVRAIDLLEAIGPRSTNNDPLRPGTNGADETTDDTPSAPDAAGADERIAIPGYEILDRLGVGGMGEVYRARQIGLNRIVAVKLVLGGRGAGSATLTRFLAEAEAIATVRHPNVVQVYECGTADGQPYLAMEFLPGGTLADRLRGAARLDPKAAAALVEKLARGVEAAHDQGIVHRDIKPANVLFDEHGEPRVSDFGLAKRGGESDLTATHAVMGTPAYMAPEQAGGKSKFVGPQADVYALGVILYECLTGGRPFASPDALVLLRQVAEVEPDRPGKRAPGIPRDVERVCLKCLAKDPAERYPTAKELADDLGRFGSDLPVLARAQSGFERARRLVRRYPLTSGLVAGLVAVTVAGLVMTSLLYLRAERARNDANANAERASLNENLATANATTATANANTATANAARADLKAALAEKTVEDMLQALGDKLSDTTDVPRVRLEMYEKALALYRQIAAEPGANAPALRRKLADTLRALALLRSELNRDGAAADYEEAVRLYRELAEEPGAAPATVRALPLTVQEYGLFLRKQGRHKDAVPLLEDAAGRLAAETARQPEDEHLQSDSLRVVGNFGVVLADAGDPDRALIVFREALKRSDSLLAAHPEWNRFRHEDATLRLRLADVLLGTYHRPAEAEPLYEAALRTLERVRELNLDRVSTATRLTKCIENYSVCLSELRKDRAAGELQERAIGIWTGLAEQFPDVAEYKLGRAVALTNSVTAYARDPAKAEARLRDAVATLTGLVDAHPKIPEYRTRLAGATGNLAVLLILRGRAADAVPLFEQARRHVYALHPDGPTTLADKDTFFRHRKGHGFALWMVNRFGDAAAAFTEAAKFAPTPDTWEEATALALGMKVLDRKADEAVREVERFLESGTFKGVQAVHAAGVFGEAHSATTDRDRKEAHAKRTVELVRTAVEAGFANPEALKTLSGFRDLQSRTDFRELVGRASENARRPPTGK